MQSYAVHTDISNNLPASRKRIDQKKRSYLLVLVFLSYRYVVHVQERNKSAALIRISLSDLIPEAGLVRCRYGEAIKTKGTSHAVEARAKDSRTMPRMPLTTLGYVAVNLAFARFETAKRRVVWKRCDPKVTEVQVDNRHQSSSDRSHTRGAGLASRPQSLCKRASRTRRLPVHWQRRIFLFCRRPPSNEECLGAMESPSITLLDGHHTSPRNMRV